MTKLLSDEELRSLFIEGHLVHNEECDVSKFGGRCDCIQSKVADNLLAIFREQKQAHVDMVIGEDEHGTICGYFANGVCNCQYDWVNRAKAEQRLRNQTGDKS